MKNSKKLYGVYLWRREALRKVAGLLFGSLVVAIMLYVTIGDWLGDLLGISPLLIISLVVILLTRIIWRLGRSFYGVVAKVTPQGVVITSYDKSDSLVAYANQEEWPGEQPRLVRFRCKVITSGKIPLMELELLHTSSVGKQTVKLLGYLSSRQHRSLTALESQLRDHGVWFDWDATA